MTLIKSISGIRGTIGGATGDTLNPLDIVKFVTSYAKYISAETSAQSVETSAQKVELNSKQTIPAASTQRAGLIVVGRDARISGQMVDQVVTGTLLGCGYDVLNIGLASTPTTELAVQMANADGGIIITASHNPRQWNALKLLNRHGEFLDKEAGNEVLRMAEAEDFHYAEVDYLGKVTYDSSFNQRHIDAVKALELVDVEAIKAEGFRVCVDSINSVGGIILPELLHQLGVEYTFLNQAANGDFQHNPEPLEKNLQGIMQEMKSGGYDLGIVVDPDVDRLAFISEDGTMFGEEYTLVSVADYVLSHTPGNAVSNLSSTRALSDIAKKHGSNYAAAAVGEVNVTTKMKEVGAVIGGEGNGGVIYPASHYGRDALVGIALFLTMLAKQPKQDGKRIKVSEYRKTLPEYSIAKNRIDLTPDTDVDAILARVKEIYTIEQAKDNSIRINDIDGVKIDFAESWVHLRKSNTEPIIRIYSEAATMDEANAVAQKIIDIVNNF